MSDEAPPGWYDDEPNLGETQAEYEANLGKFLVSFNRIEFTISSLLERALRSKGRQDLVAKSMNRMLERRIDDLEMVLLAFPDAPNLPLDEVRALGRKRNELAHGHYDPWQSGPDSFQIITRGGQPKNYPPSVILPLCDEAERLDHKPRMLDAHWDFDSIEIDPPAI